VKATLRIGKVAPKKKKPKQIEKRTEQVANKISPGYSGHSKIHPGQNKPTYANILGNNIEQNTDNNKIFEIIFMMQSNFNIMQTTINELLKKQNELEISLKGIAKNLNVLMNKK
jgi:hypothetical protein